MLNGQECTINIYQRSTGLYLDLSLSGTAVLNGVVGRDRTLIVINSYLGFVGDLVWVDTLGTSDPSYNGLGSEWLLVYLLPSEIATPAAVVPFWTPASTLVGPTPTPTQVPTAPSGPTGVVIT